MTDNLGLTGIFKLFVDGNLVIKDNNTIGSGLKTLIINHLKGVTGTALELGNMYSEFAELTESTSGESGIVIRTDESPARFWSLISYPYDFSQSGKVIYRGRGRTPYDMTIDKVMLGSGFITDDVNNEYAHFDASHSELPTELPKTIVSGKEIVIEWEINYL